MKMDFLKIESSLHVCDPAPIASDPVVPTFSFFFSHWFNKIDLFAAFCYSNHFFKGSDIILVFKVNSKLL